MRYSSFSALVLGLANLAAATFSSPSSSDSWPVGTNQEIKWDTSKLTGPCDIHLVPAGATDLTVVITDIVLGTGNTGSYQWTPEKTLTSIHVAIILVDATKTYVKSDDFIVIILEDGTLMTTTSKKTSSTVKTTIKTTLKTTALTMITTKALTSSVLVKVTSTTLLATSLKTTAVLVSTIKPTTLLSTIKPTTLLSTSTKATSVVAVVTPTTSKAVINTATLTTPAILSLASKTANSTSKLTSTAVATIMTTSKPVTLSTMALKPTTTTIASVASLLKQNATTSAPKALFTGAAALAHGSNNVISLVSGGVVGVIAVLFL